MSRAQAFYVTMYQQIGERRDPLMAPKKRSPLPGDVAGPSKPLKKPKSTSCFSENTTCISTQQLEAIIRDKNHKIEELQAEVNELKEKLNIQPIRTDTNQTTSERVDHGRYELRILGDIKQRVYTGSEVKGQNGKLLKVAICYNGEKITLGPLASAKFEILVVKGDFCVSDRRSWTAETFQGSLEEARQEVGSILKDTYISEFVNGEALIEGLTFKDNSSWAKGKKWRLGIRLLGSNGVRVLEAISNCIRVLDRHGKEKPHPPLLTDGVECLEKVGKKRALDLKRKNINTIEDFLKLLHRNRSRLLKFLGISSESDESWKTMIRHAKECDVGPDLYSYRKKNSMLFFNSVYEVVGAEFGNHYIAFDKLQDSKKILVNKRKKGFYRNNTIRNLKADFEMVDGQPIPIEHDCTGISTDDDAPQYDQTAGLQDGQQADIIRCPSHLKKDSVPDISSDTDENIAPDHNTTQNNSLIQDETIYQVQQQEDSSIILNSPLRTNSTVEDASSQMENLGSPNASRMPINSQPLSPRSESEINFLRSICNAEEPMIKRNKLKVWVFVVRTYVRLHSSVASISLP